MDLKKILDYQKKDFELYKLERTLNENENKKIFVEMKNVVQNAQNKRNILEKQAGDLLSDYNNLKKNYEENIKSANIILGKKMETASEADLDLIEEIASKISNNLSILEKMLLQEAEKVNAVLVEFNQIRKKNNLAKEKYLKHKELYENESKALQPEILEKQKEIKKLEADLDPAILSKYKQRRQDNIIPVFVPCIDKSCGGCHMELPYANLATLKSKGVLECEHCRRIIYASEN